MKVHHTPPAQSQTPWFAPEAAQINFALFPDMFMAPPAPPRAPPRTREHRAQPPEDGMFVQFCGWLGGLVDKLVGTHEP